MSRIIRGKTAKGGAAGEMPAQLASFRCTPHVTRANPSRTYCYSWLLDPARRCPAVQHRDWPIARHRLLKMGGQLRRDEWLRLVNRLLIDVKFRSIDRGSSTTSDAIFSVFYCWYMSHWKCSHSVIFQDKCMKQKSKRRKNSAVSYKVDNSYFLFLRLSHLSLGRLSYILC